MATPKVWVDTPFELIPPSRANLSPGKKPRGVQVLASEMCLVHNVLLRGLNAIYNQAVGIGARGTAKDRDDFVGFARAWATALEEHHQLEEETVFPDINRITGVPGLMDGNVEEHGAFHEGVERYVAYLDAVSSGADKYDGERLVGLVDSFGAVLRRHLSNEIDTLVAMARYDDRCDWEAWFKKTMDGVIGKGMRQATYRVSCVMCSLCRVLADHSRPTSSPSPWSSTTRRLATAFGKTFPLFRG